MRTLVLCIGLVTVAALVAEASFAAGPGPEVSRSRGRAEGVVVLWPRIVPETDDAVVSGLAERLQLRLQQVANTAAPPTKVDVRPAPERVCPMEGCKATAVGLMLAHQDGGCAALAMVGPPGEEPLRLVPLAGKFQMEDASLPFRAAPEGEVVVSEFVPCEQLEQLLDGAALARLFPPPTPVAPAEALAPAP